MKCPNCGAEVQPDSKCEYCGAYVEDTLNNTEEFINQRMMSANKNIVRMVFFVVIFLSVIMLLGTLGFFKMVGSAFSGSTGYENSSDSSIGSINSLTDAVGIVRSFDYNGNMDVEYEGNIYATKLEDEAFLTWLEETGRNITGVGIEFTTDASGNVTELAMLSTTFYVLSEQGDSYVILREGDVFVATAEPVLEQGCFYEGYYNYPKANVHSSLMTDVSAQLLMDPTCDEKREIAVSDFYTEEEITVWQIRMGTEWYYCSKELYDFCEEGSRIDKDIYRYSGMEMIYTTE